MNQKLTVSQSKQHRFLKLRCMKVHCALHRFQLSRRGHVRVNNVASRTCTATHKSRRSRQGKGQADHTTRSSHVQAACRLRAGRIEGPREGSGRV
eukprot:6093665-Pleurochrysis_carterae.AAC.1